MEELMKEGESEILTTFFSRQVTEMERWVSSSLEIATISFSIPGQCFLVSN